MMRSNGNTRCDVIERQGKTIHDVTKHNGRTHSMNHSGLRVLIRTTYMYV